MVKVTVYAVRNGRTQYTEVLAEFSGGYCNPWSVTNAVRARVAGVEGVDYAVNVQ